MLDDLDIVVQKSDEPEARRHDQDGHIFFEIPEAFAEAEHPGEGDDQRRNQENEAAHGRGAALFLMRLRPFLTLGLRGLFLFQHLNHERPQEHCGDKGRKEGDHDTDDDIGLIVLKHLCFFSR